MLADVSLHTATVADSLHVNPEGIQVMQYRLPIRIWQDREYLLQSPSTVLHTGVACNTKSCKMPGSPHQVR